MRQLLADECFGNIANRNDATTTKNDAVDLRSFLSKAKDATGSGKFGDLVGGQGEAAFTEAKENARAGIELFHPGHWVNSGGVVLLASGNDCGAVTASNSAISSAVRKPAGLTTGITF